MNYEIVKHDKNYAIFCKKTKVFVLFGSKSELNPRLKELNDPVFETKACIAPNCKNRLLLPTYEKLCTPCRNAFSNCDECGDRLKRDTDISYRRKQVAKGKKLYCAPCYIAVGLSEREYVNSCKICAKDFTSHGPKSIACQSCRTFQCKSCGSSALLNKQNLNRSLAPSKTKFKPGYPGNRYRCVKCLGEK